MSRFDAVVGLTLQHVMHQRGTRDPDRLFCEIGGKSFSHGELELGTSAYARGLIKAGLEHGDRVVVYMSNRMEYFFAMLGAQRAGGVYVPCSTLYSIDEVRYLLGNSEPTFLFTDAEHVDAARKALESLALAKRPRIVAIDFEAADATQVSEVAEPVGGSIAPQSGSDDLAMIMYTSGTTARPKGVMYTHANLLQSALTTINTFQWNSDDRLLHYFPLHHANGGMVQMGPTLMKGSAFVMVPKFSASDFGNQLKRHRITVAAVNSSHVKMILAHPTIPADSDHPCRRMLFGLSLPCAVLRSFEKRFQTRLIGSYGLTESLAFCVAGTLHYEEPDGAAGRVCSGYELIVVDDEDRELPTGKQGEVLIRYVNQHGVCRGYWRDTEATERLFRDGWLHSGDVAFFDELGWLHFVQRKKDMIKRAGFNVAPAEVERVLLGHTSVREAAVVGIPDEFREEAIVGFVTTSSETSEEGLIELCKQHLANYKVPEAVFRMEQLPEDVLGKVDRKRLREIAIDRLRADVPKA